MRNRSLVERKGREGGLGGMRRSRQGREKRGRRSREGERGGGQEGKSDCQKRGVVVYMATGNRPSYVHQLTSTSQHWWPTMAVLWVGGARRGSDDQGAFQCMVPLIDGNNKRVAQRLPKKKTHGCRRGCGKEERRGGKNLARGVEGRNSLFAVAAGGETSEVSEEKKRRRRGGGEKG